MKASRTSWGEKTRNTIGGPSLPETSAVPHTESFKKLCIQWLPLDRWEVLQDSSKSSSPEGVDFEGLLALPLMTAQGMVSGLT